MFLPVDWLPPDFPRRTVWRFGGYEFDARSRTLSSGGERVARLTPQMAVLLESTLSRAGQVCSREELCAGLWGPDYAGADLALSNLVRKLRALLNDTKSTPRFLETVPKLGYRFVGSTEDSELPSADPLLAQAEAMLERRTEQAYRAAIAIFEQAAISAPRPMLGLAVAHLLAGAHTFLPGAQSFARADDFARFAARQGLPAARGVAITAWFFLTGQAAPCRRAMDELFDSFPPTAALAGSLALFRLAEGQTHPALTLVSDWRRKHPDHQGLALLDAQLRILAGDVSGALAVTQDFLVLHAEHGTALFLQGQALDLAGRHADALSSFRQARRLLSGFPACALLEARSLARMDRKREARTVLDTHTGSGEVHLDPFYEYLAWSALGESQRAAQQLERARWTCSPFAPFLAVDTRRVR